MGAHRYRAVRRRRSWQARSAWLAVPLALTLAVMTLPATGDEVAPEAVATSAAPSEPDVAPSPTTAEPESTPPAKDDAKDDAKDEPEEAPAAADPEPAKKGLIKATLDALATGNETLTLTLKQKTGTEPFTPGDDSAGNDSGADNDIVRTNDTVTYTVGIRYEGGDQTKPTIKFTLPKGQELVSLPPFCLTGSSVSPENVPAPVVPVTTTSWQSLPVQEITCVVDDQAIGTSLDYKFIAKVRSEVPHGTSMTPVVATATSEQVTTPASSPSVSQVVSAAANFDVSKRAMSTTDTTGPLYGYWGLCSFDTSRSCRIVDYPLTLNTPAGGKGITPLASPITLKDDLRPDSFYGAGTTASAAWTAAGAAALDKYGARLTRCNNGALNLWGSIPNSKIAGGGTSENSVRDNGTITCDSSGPGTVVDITITDADTTAYTVPTKASAGAALPADSGYVISTAVRVEIPIDAVRDLGEEVSGTWTLGFKNEFTDVKADDISGEPNQGERPENNVREATTKLEVAGGFGKGFSGITGKPGNTPTGGGFSSWEYEGPPGSGSFRDGNTVVVAGQTVLSNLISTEQIPPNTGTELSRSKLMCDTWDDTKLAMPTTFDYAGSPYTRIQFPSNGSAAWISSFNYAGTWQTDLDDLENLKIEYGYTPTPGSGANSSCTTGTWSATPAGVPGATSQNGLWSGVNRVRISFSTKASTTATNFDVNASIALQALVSAGPTGTVLPNWASERTSRGVKTLEEIVDDETASPGLSTYTPAAHTGGSGDRLILGAVTARIRKYVKNRTTDDFTDTAVPQYSAGAEIDYRLNPSLTADVSAGVKAPVIVEDCLPKYQAFVSSRRANGDALSPALVQDGAPAGSELACPAGQTYIKWDLGEQTVNETVDPIIYTVEILQTVRNGNYTNTTVVSTPGDPSRLSARTDTAQIQIVTPTGVKISKQVDKPLIEINPEAVATPRTLKWTVDFANVDSSDNVSDVDVIDVLPASGLFGSDFTGTLRFDTATVAAGDDVEIQYTKRAPTDLKVDPDDASNGAAGATTWCSAATGGTVESGNGTAADCPATAAEVTGLRFLRAGYFEPTDVLTVDIAMTPIGNAGGDVYENRTAGRAAGVTQPVGPAIRRAQVIESAVGNYVWEDLDSDGIQDDDEPGVAGFPVKLVGEDLDGNPVSLTTATNENGAYSFKGLASGTYRVTFDPNGLTSNTTFTQQNAGDDDTVDSDGDVATGQTAEFALAPDSADPSWDQGLVIDRNVDITVDKRLVSQSEPDSENRATVTYEVEVANAGTAEGVYDLSDKLKFGGSIVIDEVSASNTDPGDIVVNPDFDGVDDTKLVEAQKLPGGKSHVYQVVVEATVNTAITAEQRNCTLTETEEGTGYLNEAQLVVDGVTQTDVACGTPDKPKDSDVGNGNEDDGKTKNDDEGLLPNTGGPALWLLTLGGLVLLAGVVFVAASRRGRVAVRRH